MLDKILSQEGDAKDAVAYYLESLSDELKLLGVPKKVFLTAIVNTMKKEVSILSEELSEEDCTPSENLQTDMVMALLNAMIEQLEHNVSQLEDE